MPQVIVVCGSLEESNIEIMSPLEWFMEESISEDTLFDGEVTCLQHISGYRFSVDAILLAHFTKIKENSRVLDLGTGSGIVSLILLYRHLEKIQKLIGIEIQTSLSHLAEKNFSLNGVAEKASVRQGDLCEIRTMIEAGEFDTVVCNPPFYPKGSGRKNSTEEERVARHQVCSTIGDFMKAAAYGVKNGGDVFCIYPAERSEELIREAIVNRLSIKKLRFVYSYPDPEMASRLVLFQLRKNGGIGVTVEPPFYIYKEKGGSWSEEMKGQYSPNNFLRKSFCE